MKTNSCETGGDKPDLRPDSPYGQTGIHRRMLADARRVTAFRQAITKAVRPGDVVLDAGTGTGILALLAARAGAGKVYAVEPTPIIKTARKIVEANGLGNVIELVHSCIEHACPPQQADLVMWEWIGIFGIDEGLLPLFLLARDRWLKPGGRLIPETVSVHMAPAFDTELAEERNYWLNRPYNLDFSAIWDRTVEEWQYTRHHIAPHHLAADPTCLWIFDSYRMSKKEACAVHRATVEFTIARPGTVNCLALWFDATLFGDVALSNAPDAPPTHWGRMAFPLNLTYSVETGSLIRVEFAFQADAPGDFVQPTAASASRRCELSVKVDDHAWERHYDSRAVNGA